MRIAICDDEAVFAEKLKSSLEHEFEEHGIQCVFIVTDSGEKLLSLCEKEKINVVFLDIAMPDLDGFDTAGKLRELRKDIMIVFVSSKETTVFSSYEYNPVWFVPKSQLRLLKRAVDKIVEKINYSEKESSFTQIKMENKFIEIDVREIKYFKSDGHYIVYVYKSGRQSESFRCRINEVERQLSSMWFVKTHNRFLVNLRSARSIESGRLILNDGERIPISRSQMSTVKEKFQDYFRSIR